MPADESPGVLLPSRFKHNDPVFFKFGNTEICATIHAVHFTISKVKYDLDLFHTDANGEDYTRIYNVDSVYVVERSVPKQELSKTAALDIIGRRARMDLWVPAEKAIHDAMQEVEKMPPDTRLTNAVILLQQAQSSVADFVDDKK